VKFVVGSLKTMLAAIVDDPYRAFTSGLLTIRQSERIYFLEDGRFSLTRPSA
jgi:hypothetical protein